MSVTPEYLLKGSLLALEQCGLQLRDAVRLYEAGSNANAVVLANFAREELGRHRILLDLWRRCFGGSPVTLEEIQAVDDHVEKQRAGMRSSTISGNIGTGLGKILTTRRTVAPQSREWKEADAALKQITEIKDKRTPDDRHRQRMEALYVEPKSGNQWNRPDDTSASEAHTCLQEAINDYSGAHERFKIGGWILKHDDPDLDHALEQLIERPELPAPVQPTWPK
jgi:AbiV family abortive infection protein